MSKALSEHATAITSGKEATKLANIGKSSGEKIDQFLETGTIAKLEEYRDPRGHLRRRDAAATPPRDAAAKRRRETPPRNAAATPPRGLDSPQVQERGLEVC